MAEKFYTILTNIGKASVANASALGTKVDFKFMALGDGNGNYYNPTETQTQLVNEVYRSQINHVQLDDENDNWITLSMVIPSSVGGFTVREVGIFDTEGNLLAIGKYPETYKPVLADGSSKDLTINMILEVSNTDTVTIKVDPSVVLATKKYVDNLAGVGRTTETVKKNADNIAGMGSDFDAHKADYASLFLTNANAKNSIYRGKYLGNTVTAEQYVAISSGTFTDLYIGDYWTIGDINWRIAAFNYYRNTGDTNVPGNHITIVPDTQLYTHVMNDTNITTGGYTGSKMYTAGLEQAKSTIRGIFGTHLVKHRLIYSNATVDGKASGWAWVDSEVDLMSEIMVYGSVVWGESTIGGSGYNIGVGKSQLPLFALNPRMINTRQTYWLRDVVSSAYFALVNTVGYADYLNASRAFGVRPAFSIS